VSSSRTRAGGPASTTRASFHRHFRRIVGITPGGSPRASPPCTGGGQHRPIAGARVTHRRMKQPTRDDGHAHAPATLRLGDPRCIVLCYVRSPAQQDAWGEPTTRSRPKVLRRAVDLGINFIDTPGSTVLRREPTHLEALSPTRRDLVMRYQVGCKRLPDRLGRQSARPGELRRGRRDICARCTSSVSMWCTCVHAQLGVP